MSLHIKIYLGIRIPHCMKHIDSYCISIIRAIADSPTGFVTINNLAEVVGIHWSTAKKYLVYLKELGYVYTTTYPGYKTAHPHYALDYGRTLQISPDVPFRPTHARVLTALLQLCRWATTGEIAKWAGNMPWNTAQNILQLLHTHHHVCTRQNSTRTLSATSH